MPTTQITPFVIVGKDRKVVQSSGKGDMRSRPMWHKQVSPFSKAAGLPEGKPGDSNRFSGPYDDLSRKKEHPGHRCPF